MPALFTLLTFTWRDLIHKQLGQKAAVTTIWLSAAVNLLAALYFQLVVLLPAQTDWANSGGQIAWEFLFSLQMRIVLASILTALIAELIDTKVYQLWTRGGREKWPQWTRVFASNSVSIPVDSLIFPIIAFAGVVGAEGLQQMVWTNIIVKAIVTITGLLDDLPGAGKADLRGELRRNGPIRVDNKLSNILCWPGTPAQGPALQESRGHLQTARLPLPPDLFD